jgi:uncharacterized protein
VDVQPRLTAVNPFADARSNYCRHDGTRLVRASGSDTVPSRMTMFVHDSVLALALNPHFTCLGAKSTVNQRAYRFALYPQLGDEESSAGLAHDLFSFVSEEPSIDGDFTTFIASFESPAIADERLFEQLLWTTLQQLNALDAAHHLWAAEASDDPSDSTFAFSFAETAFFVVGLHAGSPRATRRFAWPTLVFNPHRQFEALKQSGRYSRFREVIREAERRLQGAINPMSADFGVRSEAAQYSGREVDGTWKCPFVAQSRRRENEP